MELNTQLEIQNKLDVDESQVLMSWGGISSSRKGKLCALFFVIGQVNVSGPTGVKEAPLNNKQDPGIWDDKFGRLGHFVFFQRRTQCSPNRVSDSACSSPWYAGLPTAVPLRNCNSIYMKQILHAPLHHFEVCGPRNMRMEKNKWVLDWRIGIGIGIWH